MATTLGSKAIGSIVNFKVNGTPCDFIIMNQGKPSAIYDASFDGGTVLLTKNTFESGTWNSTNVNDYANSAIHSRLNNDFFALIDEKIRTEIIQVKIPYRAGSGTSTSVTSGANGLEAKVFLASGYEVGFSGVSNMPADGAAFSYFTGADDAKRISYLGGTADSWWLRSPQTNASTGAFRVDDSGASGASTCYSTRGVRPALVLPSSILVSDAGEVTTNQSPAPPASITVPATAISTQPINVTWGASIDPEGDTITYILERAYNGGSYEQVSATAERAFAEIVSASWDSIQYRVKARDDQGNESDYITSDELTVVHNQPPVISGQDGDLGMQTGGFAYPYTITDADGDSVTSTEAINGEAFRTFSPPLGVEQTANVADIPFVKLPNGPHALTITARDSAGNQTVRTMTFTKQVNGFTIGLSDPLRANEQPKRLNLVVHRHIPAGASFRAEVCNNPFDTSPVWEDATTAILQSTAHVFANRNQYAIESALDIRITVERGNAVGECWISGIGGNFE